MAEPNLVKNIFNLEDVDLSVAVLANTAELSYVGEEEKTGDFVVTMDRAKFDNLVGIVRKVLLAKGYALNLENILAMLDQFELGIRAQIDENEHPPFKVMQYIYCLKLSKPNPQIQGELIKVFYTEVKKYQKEIISLKTKIEDDKSKAKTQTVKELREEIKRLRSEVNDLESKNTALNQKLENSMRNSVRSIGNKDKSWSLDRGDLRLARVTSIDFHAGQIELKIAQSSFRFDLAELASVPSINSNCIAHIIEGTVERLFPLDDKCTDFDLVLSQVLIVSKDGIKVRDINRNILIIKLKNFDDYSRAESLVRGMPVLLFKYQNKIIKWAQLKENKINYELKMEEETLCFHYLHEGQNG